MKESDNDTDPASPSDDLGKEDAIGQDALKRQKKKSTRTSVSSSALDLDSELRGKTLRAYLFMMKNAKPIGVRELQRALDLSSPSVAYHHLEKLERLGLVEKDEYSEYKLVRNVDVRVLQAFSQVGKLLVPRFIFYAMFFTTLLVGYFLIYLGNSNIFALTFGISASAFAWYETVRTWMKRPF